MPLFNAWVLYGGLGLVTIQAIAAWSDGMLTPSQMLRGGVRGGLPFVAHGGMWGDVALTYWLAYLTQQYAHLWRVTPLTIGIIALAGIITLAMNEVYKRGTIPEAHVRDGTLTMAGFWHGVYMWGALCLIGLFFATLDPVDWHVWATCALLTVHVAVANHFVLGMVAPRWYPGKPLNSSAGWVTILGSAALLGTLGWWKLHGF